MTIIRKSNLAKWLKMLDDAYADARRKLGGEPPNPNIYDRYHDNPEHYARDFTEVDPKAVRVAVKHLRAVLDELADTKDLAEPPRHSPR